MDSSPKLIQPLVAGAAAGVATDLFFFPVDTIKTRLQAKGGFLRNGGFRRIYSGVGSTLVASAPGASLFFMVYDTTKKSLIPLVPTPALAHIVAASLGEIAACLVRVPSEVIKQRVQVRQHSSSWDSFLNVLRNRNEGVLKGLYRGYLTTLLREIPFTAIQFPFYEWLKKRWAIFQSVDVLSPGYGAICGFIAGAIAAATTTPLDVVKTRLMLEESRIPVQTVVKQISAEGSCAFFKGVVPRTLWISAGGAVFLGAYELVSSWFIKNTHTKPPK